MREAQTFLRELFGAKLPAGLKIQLWRRSDKTSHYFDSPAKASKLLEGRPKDVYACVSLAPRNLGTHKRMLARQSAGIAGLWADIDVNGGPESKSGAAPSLEAAAELASELLQPSLTVMSGYGLQAWWLLEDGPWIFSEEAEREQAARLATGWIAAVRKSAKAKGFTIDPTQDLARLMRVPDTVNGKGRGAAKVVGWPELLSEQDGPRYSIEQLGEIAESVPASALPSAQSNGVQVDAGIAEVDHVKLEGLREVSGKFDQTWQHKKRGVNWSLSEWDLSLVSQAAEAGWSDQELANLIAYHRQRYGDAEKGKRADYVARTIAKVRAGERSRREEEEQEEAIEDLRVAASDDDPSPELVLAQFNKIVGGPAIKEFIQHGRDPDTTRYDLILANGEAVHMGGVGNLLTQSKFQQRFAVVTQHVLHDVKRADWKKAIQALLKAAQVEQSEDDTIAGAVIEWLRHYIRTEATSDYDQAVHDRSPVRKDGTLYIFAAHFGDFVRGNRRIPVPDAGIKEMLRATGFARVTVAYLNPQTEKRSSASYYSITEGALEL